LVSSKRYTRFLTEARYNKSTNAQRSIYRNELMSDDENGQALQLFRAF